jgi:small-conductance mechanosensitive channel
MTGKQFLDLLAASLTALLSFWLEAVFGPAVRRPILGEFSGTDLGVLLGVVLLAALATRITGAFLRRKVRQAEAGSAANGWRTHLWQIVGRPLCLLIWVYGGYLAATPLLLKLPHTAEPPLWQQLANRLFDLGVFVVLLWVFFRSTHVIEARLRTWTAKTTTRFDDLLVPLVGRSLRVVVPVLGSIFVLPLIGLSPETSGILAKGSSMLIVGAVSWILLQCVALGEKAVLARYDITAADNLQARKVYTQVHVLSKALYVVIVILTVCSVLMLFDGVRQFGTSLLASAGVVGIIIGFAAQRTIANLFAGFQLALTQPIRLDDVVIVEGEWGRIEEITLTYVVVHIWDDRRLVVPLSFFIEKPFQNWTRVSADLLGSVFVWADYTLPIAELRPAVQRIVKGCQDWDQRFWNLQVTDTTDRAMQLRVLATAADASKAWDLRCEIRERLLAFLQQQYPQHLPRLRADVVSGLAPSATAAPPAVA